MEDSHYGELKPSSLTYIRTQKYIQVIPNGMLVFKSVMILLIQENTV